MKLTQLKKIIKEVVRNTLKENVSYDGKATLQPGQKFQMTDWFTSTVIRDLGDKVEIKIDLPQFKQSAEIKKSLLKGSKLILPSQ